MQHQWVLLGRGRFEVPVLVVQKALGLGVQPQYLVVRDQHASAASRQPAVSSSSTPSFSAQFRLALDSARGGLEVSLRHQVRVDVVVRDRAVLVRPGDSVDAEPAGRVMVTEDRHSLAVSTSSSRPESRSKS